MVISAPGSLGQRVIPWTRASFMVPIKPPSRQQYLSIKKENENSDGLQVARGLKGVRPTFQLGARWEFCIMYVNKYY